jgi:hypothetical protein
MAMCRSGRLAHKREERKGMEEGCGEAPRAVDGRSARQTRRVFFFFWKDQYQYTEKEIGTYSKLGGQKRRRKSSQRKE